MVKQCVTDHFCAVLEEAALFSEMKWENNTQTEQRAGSKLALIRKETGDTLLVFFFVKESCSFLVQ